MVTDSSLPFPLDVWQLSLDRLPMREVGADYLSNTDSFLSRITDIKMMSDTSIRFRLDGLQGSTVHLSAEESGWLQTGLLTPLQVAAHHAARRGVRFSGIRSKKGGVKNDAARALEGMPVQRSLFD